MLVTPSLATKGIDLVEEDGGGRVESRHLKEYPHKFLRVATHHL